VQFGPIIRGHKERNNYMMEMFDELELEKNQLQNILAHH